MSDKQEDDVLAQLSPEERAAYEADEGAEIDGSASLEDDMEEWASSGWEAEQPAPPPAEKAADGPDDQQAGAAEGEGSAGGGQEAGAEGDDSPPGATEEPPVKALPDMASITQKVKEIEAEESDLIAKYEDGDLDDDEFRTKIADIRSRYGDAVADQKIAARQVEDFNAQWGGAVNAYRENNPGIWDDKATLTAFDAEVRAITGSGSFDHLSFQKQLELAHRRLASSADLLGLKVPPLNGASKPSETASRKAPEGEDLGGAPRTLKDVPQSDMDPGQGGEFAELDRLVQTESDPDVIEAALAKLTPEQRERYASMAI